MQNVTEENRSLKTEQNHLTSLLKKLAPNNGYNETGISGVTIFRADYPTPPSPCLYDPCIVIVGQGCKKGYLSGEEYQFDEMNYLVLSVSLPLEAEIIEASPESPFLAMIVDIDTNVLGELMMEIEEVITQKEPAPRGVYLSPLTVPLVDSAVRLLNSLLSKSESRILGPSIIREIIYRVLVGKHGDFLYALANRQSRFTHISKVLKMIHNNYSDDFSIDSMADTVFMSASAFHHNFKSVTSLSPLQYLKKIRLHKALLLMRSEGMNASSAAYSVGYSSASQFNREFKKLFGNTPKAEVARLQSL